MDGAGERSRVEKFSKAEGKKRASAEPKFNRALQISIKPTSLIITPLSLIHI